MKRRPQISVVVPAKNEGSNINKCLRAIFSQTIGPSEVIIVDGHSEDNTIDTARKFPVRIVYEDYGTRGGARQVGVENAAGEYLAFTDADCVPERDWLKNLAKEFDKGIVGVGGGMKNTGEGLWQESVALTLDSFLGSANSVQDRVLGKKKFVKSISGSNSMYRKKDLADIGGFDISLSINEETEMNRRLAKIGKLLYTPDAKVLHEQGRGLAAFAKRMFHFGFGRGKNRLWDMQCLPPLVAPFILLSLAFTPWISMIAISLYIVLIMAMGLNFTMKQGDIRLLGSVPIVYALEHVSYTTGFWIGLLKS